MRNWHRSRGRPGKRAANRAAVVRLWGRVVRGRNLLPLLALVGAGGLLLVAVAMAEAWVGRRWAEPLFWVGLLVLFVPVAGRLLGEPASRGERIGLLALLGLELYLVKVLRSPLSFSFYDELLHVRTASDILEGGHLFRMNSLLPVSPYYPSLENVTVALAQLSGLSVFAAGLAILGAARLTLVLGLYLFYEQVSHSPRLATLSTLFYMVNPSFLFFDAQFAYESLALPLAALVLLAETRRQEAPPDRRRGPRVLVVIAVAALTATHHLTTYALLAFLFLWTAVFALANRRRPAREGPGASTLITLVAAVAWLLLVARLTVSYLGGNAQQIVAETIRVLIGEGAARRLFQGGIGNVAPRWEQIVSYAATLLILLILPVGLPQVWRRYRANALALALGMAGLAFPASHALRFTSSGAEIASRTPEFTYLPLAFILALGVERLWSLRPAFPRREAAILAGVAILFLGGVTLGSSYWARLPGPYLVAADSRSIEPQGLAAATWSRAFLGPDNHVAADRVNALLMLSHGKQQPVSNAFMGVDVPMLFFSPRFSGVEQRLLYEGNIRYLVVDRRLCSALPMVGVYIEPGEPGEKQLSILNPICLTKFDDVERASRIYDNGAIIIYDCKALSDVS